MTTYYPSDELLGAPIHILTNWGVSGDTVARFEAAGYLTFVDLMGVTRRQVRQRIPNWLVRDSQLDHFCFCLRAYLLRQPTVVEQQRRSLDTALSKLFPDSRRRNERSTARTSKHRPRQY
jgi:hypothetical protein